jgi:hypothetical protein
MTAVAGDRRALFSRGDDITMSGAVVLIHNTVHGTESRWRTSNGIRRFKHCHNITLQMRSKGSTMGIRRTRRELSGSGETSGGGHDKRGDRR